MQDAGQVFGGSVLPFHRMEFLLKEFVHREQSLGQFFSSSTFYKKEAFFGRGEELELNGACIRLLFTTFARWFYIVYPSPTDFPCNQWLVIGPRGKTNEIVPRERLARSLAVDMPSK